MTNKDLLKSISEFAESAEPPDYKTLVNDLDVLENAHTKLHQVLIATRMRKLMDEFGQRDTDIYIATYPRSGTTLMQMVLYQMTTNGDMNFEHIYDVSPWCRFSAFFNRPMPSVGNRRIIKTHDPYEYHEHIKHGKFIFVMRDCLDVISSVYQQTLDYVDPSVDFDQLTARNMKKWFDYNMKWIENQNGMDILYLHYEDIVLNKKEIISAIAKFIGVDMDDDITDRVVQRSSFEFMKRHESKFGEQPEHWKVYNNFIRNGRVGDGRIRLSEDQLKAYHNISKEYNIEGTGIQRYFTNRVV